MLLPLTANVAAAAEETATAAAEGMNVEGLITDLAFILILGAFVTVLFKWIKQPVVLGYIVAGFLASPNFEPIPSVSTEANIEFWAQIGIIVLLFNLGLEFSFKKLVNTGGSAVVTALIIVVGMMLTGYTVGYLLNFDPINCLFLGGMLSMSSTTIIIKAFTDMGLRQKKFASLVLAVLIVEDLFAVVMMVVLSSIAVNNSVEGSELLLSISKLVFFLVIWFLVGVFILPSVFNRTRRFLNNETLLVVSMGLCLGMAIFSVACGFSLALGAFVMGSILAGTSLAERIEKVTMPVKDLFGSVFFISVGMMVQPDIIVEYWAPILILSAAVIVGMIVFGTFGMLVTGQTLRVAVESGFSLTQIGEFAFIIASLGMSLGVLMPTIYPIVVAVSVITTFTTPYFIKLSDPAYRFIEKHLPRRLNFLITRYSEQARETTRKSSAWRSLIVGQLWRTLLYVIVLLAITLASINLLMPKLEEIFPNSYPWIGAAVTIAAMSPFLIALAIPTKRFREFTEGAYRVPRVVLQLFRVMIVLAFIMYVLSATVSLRVGFAAGLSLIILVALFLIGRQSSKLGKIEQRFIDNLNERELRRSGKNNAVVSDLHLAYVRVGYDCPFVGERLRDTGLRTTYGVNVSSITRGTDFIPVPGSAVRIFPGDILGVIGTDEQIQRLLPDIEAQSEDEESGTSIPDYAIATVVLTDASPLVGQTIISSDMGRNFAALVVAVESDGKFVQSLPEHTFVPGDRLTVVGPRSLPSTIS